MRSRPCSRPPEAGVHPGMPASPGASPSRWASDRGFLLAALGSAVGLGNVWRFSYVAGENGGGAFLLLYLAMVLAVGVPLLLAEFALGRSTQRESVAAIHGVAPASPWRHLGWLSLAIATLVLAYYAVVAGWVLKYLSHFVLGSYRELRQEGFAAAFGAYVARPLEPLAWHGAMLLLATAIVAKGVHAGIERLSLALMPLLAALLVALVLHGATLPGFTRGAAFLFQPDWRAWRDPAVYLAALGQAFFSLGLAMGVMVTFGSYVAPAIRLPRAALLVALGDTLVAVAAGLVIFPAVFSFGQDPAQGPGLAFVVLPEVFAQMRWGAAVGTAFFLLLAVAALTSMVSLLEVPVAWLLRRSALSRPVASWATGALLFCLGVPASLGFGAWSGLRTPAGRNLLDAMDFAAVHVLLPLNGLLLALLLGWLWPKRTALAASGIRHGALAGAWHGSLRYLLPVLLAAMVAAMVAGSSGRF